MTPTTRALLALAMIAASCGKPREAAGPRGGGAPGAGPRAPMQFPVETQRVEPRSVQYTLEAVGSVEAFEVVQATARVAGVVKQVLFREGESVKAGASLAHVDLDRYSLAVDEATTDLQGAEAALAEARAGLSRREEVLARMPGLIPAEEIETWCTRVSTARADVDRARVALQQAQLDLRDAHVPAPSSGILQTRAVQTGQYVQPGTVIATLVRREPLLLRFQVPEPDAAKLHVGMTATFRVRGEEGTLQAAVTHVAGEARAESRMVDVTAEILDPAQSSLRPGAFAEVSLVVGSSPEALVVPATAVRPTERGFVAYVVEGDVARERVLELGLRTPEGEVEVRSGLEAGDVVVVRGAEALRDGAPVRVVPKGAAEPPASARAASPPGSRAP